MGQQTHAKIGRVLKAEDNRFARTNAVIESFRDVPEEFGMLKGLLLMSMTKDSMTNDIAETLFDRSMIAKRMDEINNAVLAEARALYMNATYPAPTDFTVTDALAVIAKPAASEVQG